jgi:dihydrofolate synthase/folylpolyglutamate synthase
MYTDTVDWLYQLQFVGIKMGLDNIRSLTAKWGSPELRYPVVHIAGTNGKGSTACFLAAALQAAGYRTGLYTSPHLADFSERIRVDGKPIPAATVVEHTARMRADIAQLNATFFEATTLMAFAYFAEMQVDVAVIETGLGGRLDATNVVLPVVSVITSLSIEHREFLGDTIEDIAREKGGIIKPGIPVVTSVREPRTLAVLEDIAHERGAPLHCSQTVAGDAVYEDLGAMRCSLAGFSEPVTLQLIGPHQQENAQLAADVARHLTANGFPRLDEDAIRAGLRGVRERTGLRGRLERLQLSPEIVIDVGHNPAGVAAMLEAWCAVRSPQHTDLLFGVLKQKDLHAMFAELAKFPFRSVTLVEAASHEAATLDDMRAAAEAAGLAVKVCQSIAEWLHEHRREMPSGSTLVFGSHYVVGAFLREWPEKMHDRGILP